MNIQKIEIDKLKAAEYNPRVALKAGDKEYEKLKRSIREFGFVEPIGKIRSCSTSLISPICCSITR